jgi:hypothetical protein
VVRLTRSAVMNPPVRSARGVCLGCAAFRTMFTV